MREPETLFVRARLEARATRFLDVAFEAPPGVTVLFGPSGAGKSTTLSIVAGLLEPTSGRVALGEEVLFDDSTRVNVAPHLRRVALVFQSLALFPHMSVIANVAYGVPRPASVAEREGRARQWCERMRVGHVLERRPETLSGGEAQRVALARALASEPRALLLDEPFTALDSELRVELGRELRAIVDDLRLPTVLVTHDREDARALGDRAVGIALGRVTGSGLLDDVLGLRVSGAPTSPA